MGGHALIPPSMRFLAGYSVLCDTPIQGGGMRSFSPVGSIHTHVCREYDPRVDHMCPPGMLHTLLWVFYWLVYRAWWTGQAGLYASGLVASLIVLVCQPNPSHCAQPPTPRPPAGYCAQIRKDSGSNRVSLYHVALGNMWGIKPQYIGNLLQYINYF